MIQQPRAPLLAATNAFAVRLRLQSLVALLNQGSSLFGNRGYGVSICCPPGSGAGTHEDALRWPA